MISVVAIILCTHLWSYFYESPNCLSLTSSTRIARIALSAKVSGKATNISSWSMFCNRVVALIGLCTLLRDCCNNLNKLDNSVCVFVTVFGSRSLPCNLVLVDY